MPSKRRLDRRCSTTVPTHVRDLATFGETHHSPREDVEAGVHAAFFGDGHQRLQTHAHAEKRPIGGDVLADRLDQPQGAQVIHGVSGRADARQDDDIGVDQAQRGLTPPLAALQPAVTARITERRLPRAIVEHHHIEFGQSGVTHGLRVSAVQLGLMPVRFYSDRP